MATETFRSIEYSDPNKFVEKDGRIELKRYSEDLLLYADFDSTINAKYSVGDSAATIAGTVAPENNGVFAQHAHVQNGYARFNENNFELLKDVGTVKFRVKTNFTNNPGSQSFIRTATPEITSVPSISNTNSRYGGGSLNLIGNGEKRIEYGVSNLSAAIQTGTIDFFFKANYTGTPNTDIMFFDFYNGTNSSNRIQIFHSTDGNMYFRVYDQSQALTVNIAFAWSADNSWHNTAFSFDGNNGQSRAFIDGTQYGPTSINTFTRTTTASGYVGIGSSNGYASNYYLDDLAVFSTVKFSANYSVRNISYYGTEDDIILLAKYDTTTTLDVGVAKAPLAFYPPTGDYEFRLLLNGTYYTGGDIPVVLNTGDSMTDIYNKLALALNGAAVSVTLESEGNITIAGDFDGDIVEIEEPLDGNSLVQLLDGTQPSIIPNGPSVDTDILDLYNGTDNNNRITLTHTTASNLVLKMYNDAGTIQVEQDFGVWSNNQITWYAFELNWNDSIGQFFIDGSMVGLFQTGYTRGEGTQLYIRAGLDTYRFDELIVYNTYKHNKSYTVETEPLYEYDSTNPYIDINFGSGFKEDEVKDLNLRASSGVYYVVKLDNNWYYYIANAWKTSDGSFQQSNGASVMELNFFEIYFNENQNLIIRAYFSSDGQTNVWIDEIKIVTETTADSPARITSSVDISTGVDLSSDQHITIRTNLGSQEVDLSTEVPALPAEHIGNADLSSGFDWATNGTETFLVDGSTVSLNIATTTIQEVIDLIALQLPIGVEAFISDLIYVGLRTTELGPAASLDLTEGTGGLVRLGMIEDVYSGADPDLTSVTIEQILDAINVAKVSGLAPAATDGDGHIVLQTTTLGKDALISVSEGITSNALDVAWGYEASDSGEEAEGTFFDYSVIYDWIRSMLGAPIIPVELTDEQLENCVGRAVYWYNYYREAKEDLVFVSLNGNEHEGYEIPQEVGGEKNVIEVIVRPRFPFAYYTGGDVNGIMSNLYLQWMFQQGRNSTQFKDFIGDYYITLSTEADYNIILGTQIKWNFYNGRIFISPPPTGMTVGIVFKSSVSISEINTNSLIRAYALGEAKQILGTIRATFGGSIPGGTENIQLRGESMIAEGKEEVRETLDRMQKLSEPLFLSWG